MGRRSNLSPMGEKLRQSRLKRRKGKGSRRFALACSAGVLAGLAFAATVLAALPDARGVYRMFYGTPQFAVPLILVVPLFATAERETFLLGSRKEDETIDVRYAAGVITGLVLVLVASLVFRLPPAVDIRWGMAIFCIQLFVPGMAAKSAYLWICRRESGHRG